MPSLLFLAAFMSGPPYHQILLSTAQKNLDTSPAVALVTAHMACEIYVERAMAAAFQMRGVEFLEEAVTDLFQSNNLANQKVRNIYVALTGDAIHDAPFWSTFKNSSELRNKAIHKGRAISRDEAQTACEVVGVLIAHVDTTMNKIREQSKAASKAAPPV